jgi:hypothetical protein
MYGSLTLLLLASAAFAGVKTDYDHLARFSQYQTFAWKAAGHRRPLGNNSLLRSRIENAVDQQLVRKGMHESASNPDVYLSYRFRTQDIAYPAWGHGWRHWGWGGTTIFRTPEDVYSQGVLRIEMADAKTGQLIWTAYCTDTGSNLLDVQSAKKIDKLVAGAFKHFPPDGNRDS